MIQSCQELIIKQMQGNSKSISNPFTFMNKKSTTSNPNNPPPSTPNFQSLNTSPPPNLNIQSNTTSTTFQNANQKNVQEAGEKEGTKSLKSDVTQKIIPQDQPPKKQTTILEQILNSKTAKTKNAQLVENSQKKVQLANKPGEGNLPKQLNTTAEKSVNFPNKNANAQKIEKRIIYNINPNSAAKNSPEKQNNPAPSLPTNQANKNTVAQNVSSTNTTSQALKNFDIIKQEVQNAINKPNSSELQSTSNPTPNQPNTQNTQKGNNADTSNIFNIFQKKQTQEPTNKKPELNLPPPSIKDTTLTTQNVQNSFKPSPSPSPSTSTDANLAPANIQNTINSNSTTNATSLNESSPATTSNNNGFFKFGRSQTTNPGQTLPNSANFASQSVSNTNSNTIQLNNPNSSTPLNNTSNSSPFTNSNNTSPFKNVINQNKQIQPAVNTQPTNIPNPLNSTTKNNPNIFSNASPFVQNQSNNIAAPHQQNIFTSNQTPNNEMNYSQMQNNSNNPQLAVFPGGQQPSNQTPPNSQNTQDQSLIKQLQEQYKDQDISLYEFSKQCMDQLDYIYKQLDTLSTQTPILLDFFQQNNILVNHFNQFETFLRLEPHKTLTKIRGFQEKLAAVQMNADKMQKTTQAEVQNRLSTAIRDLVQIEDQIAEQELQLTAQSQHDLINIYNHLCSIDSQLSKLNTTADSYINLLGIK